MKYIAVVSENRKEFTDFIGPIIGKNKDIVKTMNKRRFVTDKVWYHSVVTPLDVCGISFHDLIILEKAFRNPKIPDILDVLHPSFYPLGEERALEVREMFEKLTMDYKTKN